MTSYKTTARQRDAVRAWQVANPFRFMWLAARARARRGGRAFTISEDDVRDAWPRDGLCPALKIKLWPPGASRGTTRSGPRDDSATLDRINNELGYEPGNVAIISWRANKIKDCAGEKEISAVARWLRLRDLM